MSPFKASLVADNAELANILGVQAATNTRKKRYSSNLKHGTREAAEKVAKEKSEMRQEADTIVTTTQEEITIEKNAEALKDIRTLEKSAEVQKEIVMNKVANAKITKEKNAAEQKEMLIENSAEVLEEITIDRNASAQLALESKQEQRIALNSFPGKNPRRRKRYITTGSVNRHDDN